MRSKYKVSALALMAVVSYVCLVAASAAQEVSPAQAKALKWFAQSGDPTEVSLKSNALACYGSYGHDIDPTLQAFDLSHDGRLRAHATSRGIFIYEDKQESPIGRYEREGLLALWVKFSPDGTELAFADANTIHILNARTCTEIATIPCERCVAGAYTEPPAALVFTDSKKVRVWSSAYRTYLHTFDLGAIASRIAISPQNEIVACSSTDGRISLWNLRTGDRAHEVSISPHVAQAIQFSPDGKLLFCSTNSRQYKMPSPLRAWQVSDGKEIAPFPGVDQGVAIAFSSSGNRVAVATENATIHLFDMQTRNGVGFLESDGVGSRFLRFADDDRRLISASPDPLRNWNLRTLKDESGKFGHVRKVEGIAVGSDSSIFASWSAADRSLRAWNINTGVQLWHRRLDDATRGCVGFGNESILVNGVNGLRTFAFVSGDVQSAGSDIAHYPKHVLAASPDLSKVAFQATHQKAIDVAEVASGRIVASLVASANVIACSIDAHGVNVVTQRGTLEQFDGSGASRAKSIALLDSSIDAARLSTNSGRVACSTASEVVVLDLKTYERRLSYPIERDFAGKFALSADGQLLVDAGNGHKVVIHNINEGRRIAQLDRPQSPISAIAFTRKNDSILLGDATGHLFLWRFNTE